MKICHNSYYLFACKLSLWFCMKGSLRRWPLIYSLYGLNLLGWLGSNRDHTSTLAITICCVPQIVLFSDAYSVSNKFMNGRSCKVCICKHAGLVIITTSLKETESVSIKQSIFLVKKLSWILECTHTPAGPPTFK